MKKLLFFAIVLLALVGYIYKIQIPGEEAKREAKLWLNGLAPKELSQITVKNGSEIVTLKNNSPIKYEKGEEKGDLSINVETWRLSDLPEAKLDAGAVNSLINALTNLSLENPIPSEEREADLSIYGLDKPIVEVTTEGKTLLVGKQSEYSGIRYLKTAGSDDIYTANSFSLESFTKKAADFRNRSPIAFNDSEIQSFSVKTKNDAVTVESSGDNEWRIVVPAKAKASSHYISQYLNQLRNLRVKQFFDGSNRKEIEKDISIALTYKDQTKHPKPLIINVSKDQFEVEGESASYQAESDSSGEIAIKFNDLREKRFVIIDPEKVDQLTAEFADGEKYTLNKKDNKWTVEGEEADDAFAYDLLNSLSELEASDFATAKESSLIEPTELKYILGDKTLKISKEQNFNNSTVRFAMFGDDPLVYVLTPEKFKRILKRKEALKKVPEAGVFPNKE